MAYPVSKILDVLLGEEIGNVYNRERLKELVRVSNEFIRKTIDYINLIEYIPMIELNFYIICLSFNFKETSEIPNK